MVSQVKGQVMRTIVGIIILGMNQFIPTRHRVYTPVFCASIDELDRSVPVFLDCTELTGTTTSNDQHVTDQPIQVSFSHQPPNHRTVHHIGVRPILVGLIEPVAVGKMVKDIGSGSVAHAHDYIYFVGTCKYQFTLCLYLPYMV